MSFTKDQLLALMNTIDFATDNDASYEEYTILQSGTSDLEPIRDILYNAVSYTHLTLPTSG